MTEVRIPCLQSLCTLYDAQPREGCRTGVPVPSGGTTALSAYHAYKSYLFFDTEEIAAVCREKGARLILDLTEDPRLPFAEETARAAFGAADILLFHLPDAGGTVIAARSCADTDILSRSLWLSGGSCPEKTAEDIDYAVYRLQRESVSETLDGIGKWRERIAALPGLSVKAEGGDPFAVTVLTGDRGLRGPGAAAHLALAGVAVDCAYGGVTIHFDPAREDLFQKAYEAFRTLPYGKGALKPLPSFVLAAPAAVEPALAAAYHDTVPRGRAAGKVSACFLPCTACSCPVVLPGERIGEGAARFLNAAGETDLIEVIPDA